MYLGSSRILFSREGAVSKDVRSPISSARAAPEADIVFRWRSPKLSVSSWKREPLEGSVVAEEVLSYDSLI